MARVITIPIGPIFTSGPCRGLIHVIQRGDTLYLLGKRYHVPVSSIMYANPYVNIYNLQIGDELCIPVGPQPRTGQEMGTPVPQMEPMPGQDMTGRGMPQGEFGTLPPAGVMDERMPCTPAGVMDERMPRPMPGVMDERMPRPAPGAIKQPDTMQPPRRNENVSPAREPAEMPSRSDNESMSGDTLEL